MSTDRTSKPDTGVADIGKIGEPPADGVPAWQRRDPVAVDPVQYKAWCDDKLATMRAETSAAHAARSAEPQDVQRSLAPGVELQPDQRHCGPSFPANPIADAAHATFAALDAARLVQARALPNSLDDGNRVQHLAAAGVAGAATALPHGDQIQASFGHHDVSGVQAHVGGAASDAAAQMGAQAYATGNQVAFAAAPDLHLAAHEAAHVVQQRTGVSLKGGVGQAGDAYEQHADAVADAVVRGESAAGLLDRTATTTGDPGGAVQRQAAPAHQVDVTVEWTSPFGNDVTGKVTLQGTSDDTHWTTISTLPITSADTVTFAGADYYKRYRAEIKPSVVPAKDGDVKGQFQNTTLTIGHEVAPGTTGVVIKGGLALNRWYEDNVRQRHGREGLDPDMTDESNIHAHPLFGRVVRVHDLLEPRVAATDALYQALPDPKKVEIAASLFVTGGYAYRNIKGKAGGFSDHSVGLAIDVNYNEGKEQNALMEDSNELGLLNELVQPVVQSDPDHASFNVWGAKGQEQLEASHVFNERFPAFLAALLDRDADVVELAADDVAVAVGEAMDLWGGSMSELAKDVRAKKVHDIFATITLTVLDKAAKRQQDPDKKRQLELIHTNWTSLKAWIFGTKVVDQHAGMRDEHNKKLKDEKKTATGMIPLNETVLQMFLDAGWEWGGDWGRGTRKDYMHFQDESVMDKLKV